VPMVMFFGGRSLDTDKVNFGFRFTRFYQPTGYPATFHASTPPPSALAFRYPWAMYFAARPAALASPGQAQ